uniref:GSK3-beta interaction protein n=1 Tax=Aceria tosichella TaxID=561515 RepID=A0A6G1SDG3_9ACAR
MDWKDEASALIDDIKNYVNKIELSKKHESSDTRIYFEIETLERVTLIVSMDANGFIVCDSESGKKHLDIHEDNSDKPEKEISEDDDTQQLGSSSIKVYETIYSLLDDNSPKYREAFAGDLYNRMRSLE